MNPPLDPEMERWQRYATYAGLGGLALCLLGALFNRAEAVRSYWFAWLFWSGIGFGSIAALTMYHLTAGAWGRALERPARAAVQTLPGMLLLIVPVLLAMPALFSWAGQLPHAHPEPHKGAYLTVSWFIIRTAFYFAAMIALGFLLLRRHRSPARMPRLATISGPGLVLYVLCMNFASADWVMSLQPQWYSTMLAVIFIVSQFLSALAFGIVVVTRPGVRPQPDIKQLHDLGNLLLAFVVFWTYVTFAQFLIIWSGNLPREISWYLPRRSGGWQYVAVFLGLFQFAVPFALLLSREAKRHRNRLAPIAVLVLAANVVNVFWLVKPAFSPARFSLHWLDLAAFAGVGGVWIWMFIRGLVEPPQPAVAAEGRTHD